MRHGLIYYLIYIYSVTGIKNFRVMLACETYPELEDRHINKLHEEIPSWLGEVRDPRGQGFGLYLNDKYGGGILALRNLDKPEKYQSAEFGAIGVDELTQNPKTKFDLLRGSLRWPGLAFTPFIGATNPGGIGHRWVKDLWIDRNFSEYPEMMPLAHQFNFIQSLPSDNPHLMREYWEMLNTLPPQLAKAWVHGDWDVFQGQAFLHYSDDKHQLKRNVDLPISWPRWRAVDYGFAAPFVCGWFCKDPDTGRIFVYRLVRRTGLTSQQQAKLILENTPPDEQISLTYADPSMWARKELEGKVASTADEYEDAGVPLTKADNDRLMGKRKVDQVLQNLADGIAGLLIFPECANLGKTLANLALDESNVEDVDTNQDDHDYDMLKYGLTNIKTIYLPRENTEPQTTELELAARRGLI